MSLIKDNDLVVKWNPYGLPGRFAKHCLVGSHDYISLWLSPTRSEVSTYSHLRGLVTKLLYVSWCSEDVVSENLCQFRVIKGTLSFLSQILTLFSQQVRWLLFFHSWVNTETFTRSQWDNRNSAIELFALFQFIYDLNHLWVGTSADYDLLLTRRFLFLSPWHMYFFLLHRVG